MKCGDMLFRIMTIITLAFLLCWGAAMVIYTIKPFWRDEWCLIYNLKFKPPKMLWGPLDFTQQFPRVYLQCIKFFSAQLGYSYCSLRFPSYLAGTGAVFLCYNLMNRLFAENGSVKFLFLFIVVAHPVFIDYFVQIKQYEMEILLCLVALWQLLELLRLRDKRLPINIRYLFLCASFLVVPFFSYTYPIAIAPVFFVLFLHDFLNFKNRNSINYLKQNLPYLWMPLIISLASIGVFYAIDISQLMGDKDMYGWWSGFLITHETTWKTIIEKMWLFFAKAGAGFVFEIIFGILSIISFGYAAYFSIKRLDAREYSRDLWVMLYSVTLILLVFGLYFAGKLPLGQPRFNIFTIPSVAILIVFLIATLQKTYPFKKFAAVLIVILFIALTGNIYTACLNLYISDEYRTDRKIYWATEDAINFARKNKMPILVTPAVGFPDDITLVMTHLSMPTAAGILKTLPAYKVDDTIAIYTIKDLKEVTESKRLLAPGVKFVVAGDGLSYKVFRLISCTVSQSPSFH